MEYVVLVDEQDNETGVMEKLEAHEKGLLHRAISVFVFNSKGELLLQQRALGKYHSAGLWTNTCCSHPRPDEKVAEAAVRRLKEEMGLECALQEAFTFVYRSEYENGLTEHEYDHVFIGYSESMPEPDINEVHCYKYIDLQSLIEDVATNAQNYTTWFRICLPLVKDYLQTQKEN